MAAGLMILQAIIAAGPEFYKFFKLLFPGVPLPTWKELAAQSDEIDRLIAIEMAKV